MPATAWSPRSTYAAVAGWRARAEARAEIPFMPARVLLQDFTGVPCVVDLAAMRAAVARLGGDPRIINPQVPVDLVIDHSVQVDYYGTQRRVRPQREPGDGAQPRALHASALGPERVPQRLRGSYRHRHRPPDQPGYLAAVVQAEGVEAATTWVYPGHRGGHRLPLHHGQRSGRARLGRGRHRGRGRHARPAVLHAGPRRRGCASHRRARRRRPQPPTWC